MKNNFKKILSIFVVGVLVLGVAYAYLRFNLNKEITPIEQKQDKVPYQSIPDNCGIALVFPSRSALLVYLDFYKEEINLLKIEDFSVQPEYNGYTAEYMVEISYDTIEGFIDRIGGIELELDGVMTRCTGPQVIDVISSTTDTEIRNELIDGIFAKISKNNFSKYDFLYIIENSKTNLSVIDCLFWVDHLEKMSGNVSFVN